jgi:hypothetical protein
MALILKTFSKTVTTAGTRVALSSSQLLTEAFTIRAKAANTGNIFVGDSTVTSSTGMFLAAGESNEKEAKPTNRGVLKQFDLAKVYLDASSNGDGVIVEYLSDE